MSVTLYVCCFIGKGRLLESEEDVEEGEKEKVGEEKGKRKRGEKKRTREESVLGWIGLD